jgi:hypothetical protein
VTVNTSRAQSVLIHDQALQDASGQSGTIARAQLRFRGLTDAMISSQIEDKRWTRLLPGVYLTNNGIPPIEAWWWAVHLYAGSKSAIAGASALQRWGVREPALPVTIEIPHTKQMITRPGFGDELIVWRRRTQRPARALNDLPPTVKLPDTVIDVSDELSTRRGIGDLVTSACQTQYASAEKIRRALTLRPRVTNRALVEGVLAELEGGADSVLEMDGVVEVLRAHGLPEGRGQVRGTNHGANIRHDRVLDGYGIVLEFDGRLGHDGYSNRIRDHQRDNTVAAAGGQTLRFGWEAVHERSCESAAQIATVLRHRGWTGSATECGPQCRVFGS